MNDDRVTAALQNPLPRWGRGGPSRRVAAVSLLLAATLVLTGCGKKGAPQPPPDEPNTYPRVYPSG